MINYTVINYTVIPQSQCSYLDDVNEFIIVQYLITNIRRPLIEQYRKMHPQNTVVNYVQKHIDIMY